MELQKEDFMDEIFKTVQLPDVKYTDPNYKANVRVVKQTELHTTNVEHQTNGHSHHTLEYSSKEITINGTHEITEDILHETSQHNHLEESNFHEVQETHHNGYDHDDEEQAEEANLDEFGWKSVVHNNIFIEGSEFAETNNMDYTRSDEAHEDEPTQLHYDSMNNYVEDHHNFQLETSEIKTHEDHKYDEVESTDESPTLPRKTESRDRLIEEFKKHHTEQEFDDNASSTDTLDHGHMYFDQDHHHHHNIEREVESDEETEVAVVTVRQVDYHFDSEAVHQVKEPVQTLHKKEFETSHADHHYDEVSHDEETHTDVTHENESTYSDFERYVGVEYETPRHSIQEETPRHSIQETHVPDFERHEYRQETKSRSSTESTLTPPADHHTDKHVREIEVRTQLHVHPHEAYSTYDNGSGKQVLDDVKEAPGVRNLKSLFEKQEHTRNQQKHSEHHHHHHQLEKHEPIHHQTYDQLIPDNNEDHHYHDYQIDRQDDRTRTSSQTSGRQSIDSTQQLAYTPYFEPTQNQIAHAISDKGEAEVVYEHQLSVHELRAKFGVGGVKPTTVKRKEIIEPKSRSTTASTVHTAADHHESKETKSRTNTTSSVNTTGYKEPHESKSRTSTTSTVRTRETKEPKSRTNTTSTVNTIGHKEPHESKSRTSTTSTVRTYGTKEPKSRTNTTSSINTTGYKEPHESKSRTSTTSTVRTYGTKEPTEIKSRTSTTSTVHTTSTLRPDHIHQELETEIKPQPKARRPSTNSIVSQKNEEKEPAAGSLAALQKSLKAYAPKEIHVSPQITPESPMSPLEKFHSVRVVKNVREFVKVWGYQPMDIPYQKRVYTPKMSKVHEVEEKPTRIDRATSYHTIDVDVRNYDQNNISKRSSIASAYSQQSKRTLPTHFETNEHENEPEVKLESAETANLLMSSNSSLNFNESPETHLHRAPTPEIDDDELSKMSVRDRMKFFQQDRSGKDHHHHDHHHHHHHDHHHDHHDHHHHHDHHDHHHHVKKHHELEQIIDQEEEEHHLNESDHEIAHTEENHTHPKRHVKRNISLLIQELTNRNH